MARSRGFEPLTAWFVARYSIQLSYERAIYSLIYLLTFKRESGASERIRTSDRLVRSQVLYPAELRTRRCLISKPLSLFQYQELSPFILYKKFPVEEMARSRGFEPLTAWFVARYSIQLSYERAIFSTKRVVKSITNNFFWNKKIDSLVNKWR